MKYMTKAQMVEKYRKHFNMSHAEANRVVSFGEQIVINTVASGKGIRLIGFGGWKPSYRRPRKGRNPQTGKALKVAGRFVPSWKAGRSFKEAVRKNLHK